MSVSLESIKGLRIILSEILHKTTEDVSRDI